MILAQLPGELAGADVDRENFFRAVLKKAIGESARGRTQIDCYCAASVDIEMAKRMLEFVSSAADVFFRHIERELVGGGNGVARLTRGLRIDPHLPGHNRPLGLLAAIAQ